MRGFLYASLPRKPCTHVGPPTSQQANDSSGPTKDGSVSDRAGIAQRAAIDDRKVQVGGWGFR